MNKERAIQYLLYKHHNRQRVIPNVHTEKYGGSEVDALYLTSTNRAFFYEIKCSKSDFKADAKKKRHQQFLNRDESMNVKPKYFYYVCHGFDINAEDVPSYAGLYVCNKYGLELVKEAPLLWKAPLTTKNLEFLNKKIMYRYLDIKHKRGKKDWEELSYKSKAVDSFETFVDSLVEKNLMREAMLKIRKIRRDTCIPCHEDDEIYNIAMEALNDR